MASEQTPEDCADYRVDIPRCERCGCELYERHAAYVDDARVCQLPCAAEQRLIHDAAVAVEIIDADELEAYGKPSRL